MIINSEHVSPSTGKVTREGTKLNFTPQDATDQQYLESLERLLERPEFHKFETTPIQQSEVIVDEGPPRKYQSFSVIMYNS